MSGNETRVDLSEPCDHVTAAMPRKVHRPPPGCEDCLKIGGEWVHLRVCLTCGHVGCCGSAPHPPATGHNRHPRHPIVPSGEVGETWAYCSPHDAILSSE